MNNENANQPAYPIENWKWVVGYEGLYEVSDLGSVKSKDRLIAYPDGRRELRIGKILKMLINVKNGYCYVGLYKHLKVKMKRVHRLVAEAHIHNPDNLPQVNHEDFDRENNKKTNLKWCDGFYQSQHAAKREGRNWQKHRLGKTGLQNPASKPVRVLSLSGENLGEYESAILASKALGCCNLKIGSVCRGDRNTHNNLKFEFI